MIDFLLASLLAQRNRGVPQKRQDHNSSWLGQARNGSGKTAAFALAVGLAHCKGGLAQGCASCGTPSLGVPIWVYSEANARQRFGGLGARRPEVQAEA